jgi:hypothetical protein
MNAGTLNSHAVVLSRDLWGSTVQAIRASLFAEVTVAAFVGVLHGPEVRAHSPQSHREHAIWWQADAVGVGSGLTG